MKPKAMLAATIAILCLVPGCQCLSQCGKEFQSQTSGIDRDVRVYDYNGHLLGQWHSKTVIDADSGGLTTFFNERGGRVLVNGGVLISEERP